MTEPTGPELVRRRRELPHWEQGGQTYFITSRSARGALPPAALKIISAAIEHDDGRRYDLAFAVVMPDHVHLLLRPANSARANGFPSEE